MSTPLDPILVERIYRVVAQVPRGMVSTYGDIATIVGGCDARGVGYALNALPKVQEAAVPWQRIISASGGISTRGSRQRALLEVEGIAFDLRGRADLGRHRWSGPDAAWAAANEVMPLPPSAPPSAEQQGQLRLL